MQAPFIGPVISCQRIGGPAWSKVFLIQRADYDPAGFTSSQCGRAPRIVRLLRHWPAPLM
jgi:hypothetical protein